MSEVDRSHLPIRRPAFSGVVEQDARRIAARLEPHRAPDAARGRAERAAGAHRRRRLREPEHVRRPDPDAELHPHRRGRGALQPVPRHRAVLADARRAADRAEQPRAWASARSASSRAASRATRRTLPRDCAPLPRILKDNGYSTAAFGKWHLTPDGQQGPAGPFDRWPNGWGFDYFYGFLGGGASQWDPCLAENQKIIGTPPEFYDEDDPYYFPDAMADRTIEWLHGDPRAGRAQAVLRLLLDRLQPRAAPRRRRSGPTSTRASSTRDGTSSARRRSPARRSSASSPPTPSSRRATRRSRRGTTSPTTSRRSTRARWRCTPASRRTPTTTSAG